LTEIASNIINLEISFFTKPCILIVSGITINKVISFVRNVDSNAENKIKKSGLFALSIAMLIVMPKTKSRKVKHFSLFLIPSAPFLRKY